MKKKQRIGILFGGRSGEHEVSLLSAASILKAIDKKKYDVVPIGITKQGQWVTASDAEALLTGKQAPENPRLAGDPATTATAAVLKRGEAIIIPPVPAQSLQPLQLSAGSELAASRQVLDLDVIFPVLHGTFGEDGTIQGLFELADIAYVGSGVLGSAAGMDKAVMKKLFAAAGLPQTPWISVLRSEWRTKPKACTKKIEATLRYPVFVKPANLGSSVGISKVHDRSELAAAMDEAASFDRKLVIEQGVGGKGAKPRELEVAVLGNDTPEASVVGEIVPGAEFYDYEAKYLSDASVPIIPAKLTAAESKQIRQMAIEAFKACDCAGLARVDFLMEPPPPARKGKPGKKPRIFLNEINTLPGFTSISMYPKLWEASGLPYKQLIDRLIQLAVERHKEKQQTQFSRS
ncbi:D-alanine--D-alanine ligase family protein [Edaphobacter modestus]|uniref:D-alanine--D-alanine ligase n=1 Tax=Edaphobacter modestus TaxID=388466 RepID=A0A4Q7YXR1_9BACT|nr:D-alanine--D-alanine ligase family protein [Edaphobacter modestus]RZU42001.1 D-alanine-D-alanine ligase [Edaphobacter modestus]